MQMHRRLKDSRQADLFSVVCALSITAILPSLSYMATFSAAHLQQKSNRINTNHFLRAAFADTRDIFFTGAEQARPHAAENGAAQY
jgi:hypothetical protein